MITYRYRLTGAAPVRTEVRFYNCGRNRWIWRERDTLGRIVTEGECDTEDLPDDVMDAARAAPVQRPYVLWCEGRVSK